MFLSGPSSCGLSYSISMSDFLISSFRNFILILIRIFLLVSSTMNIIFNLMIIRIILLQAFIRHLNLNTLRINIRKKRLNIILCGFTYRFLNLLCIQRHCFSCRWRSIAQGLTFLGMIF